MGLSSSHIALINFQWKPLPSTTECHIKAGLEAAYPDGVGHCEYHPPIIHRDLKSVKSAGRQGLQPSMDGHHRNEPANEKSDIYSSGVVLWELATGKVPWETLNSMQVIGAVGFMNQRLEIPKDVDPLWISLMQSCWHSETKLRPTFQELMERLSAGLT
ncbi:PAS domain-containing protein tyrosine kinase family protein [Raphanus sativus]|nr:PAS domain-containing protein tyrosine kinase family protein [Raphanus sativus]